MIPGFGRVATPWGVTSEQNLTIKEAYKNRQRNQPGLKTSVSKDNLEKTVLPATTEENKAHVAACLDPSSCWRCLYFRNRDEWETRAELKSSGHRIGTWLSMSKTQEDNGNTHFGLTCLVCRKFGVDNAFAHGTVQCFFCMKYCLWIYGVFFKM